MANDLIESSEAKKLALNKSMSTGAMAFVGAMLGGPLGTAVGATLGYLLSDPIFKVVDSLRGK